MSSRLPWQRNPAGGFIAYPEGERFRDRWAKVEPNTASGQAPWQWLVSWDAGRDHGVAATRQAAADQATEAWPGTRRRGEAIAAKQAEEEALRTLVQRMATKGDLSLSVFGIETSSSDKLRSIIWLLTHGGLGSIDGPAKPLVQACSSELGRRRRGS